MSQEGTSKQEASVHRATSRGKSEGSVKQAFKILVVAREETAAWRKSIRRRRPAPWASIAGRKGGISQAGAVLTGAQPGD